MASLLWRKRLAIVLFLLMPSIAHANARRLDWLPWLIGIAITSTVLAWIWAKRTKMLENIHLRIIGFSVYFWLLAFAQIGLLMVLYGLMK